MFIGSRQPMAAAPPAPRIHLAVAIPLRFDERAQRGDAVARQLSAQHKWDGSAAWHEYRRPLRLVAASVSRHGFGWRDASPVVHRCGSDIAFTNNFSAKTVSLARGDYPV